MVILGLGEAGKVEMTAGVFGLGEAAGADL